MTRYAIVPIDESVDLNDSRLPSDMIWSGGEVYDELRDDKDLDLDSCAIAVGIYREMVRRAPTISINPAEGLLFGALNLVERDAAHDTNLGQKLFRDALRDIIFDRIRGRADVEVALKAYRERVLEKIQDVRSSAAANFSPEFSGGKGEARCNSLYDAYKAVEGLEL